MAGDVTRTATRLDDLIQLLRDLVLGVNALRNDFRAHDHGATYAQNRLRINAAPDATIQGTESSAAVSTDSTVADFEAMWDEFLRILGAPAPFINRSRRF